MTCQILKCLNHWKFIVSWQGENSALTFMLKSHCCSKARKTVLFPVFDISGIAEQNATQFGPISSTIWEMCSSFMPWSLKCDNLPTHVFYELILLRKYFSICRTLSTLIGPVKVFRTITHNTHIIVWDVLYAHGMSRLHGV